MCDDIVTSFSTWRVVDCVARKIVLDRRVEPWRTTMVPFSVAAATIWSILAWPSKMHAETPALASDISSSGISPCPTRKMELTSLGFEQQRAAASESAVRQVQRAVAVPTGRYPQEESVRDSLLHSSAPCTGSIELPGVYSHTHSPFSRITVSARNPRCAMLSVRRCLPGVCRSRPLSLSNCHK